MKHIAGWFRRNSTLMAQLQEEKDSYGFLKRITATWQSAHKDLSKQVHELQAENEALSKAGRHLLNVIDTFFTQRRSKMANWEEIAERWLPIVEKMEEEGMEDYAIPEIYRAAENEMSKILNMLDKIPEELELGGWAETNDKIQEVYDYLVACL